MDENLNTLSFNESNLLDPLVYLTKIPGKKVRTKLIQVCRFIQFRIFFNPKDYNYRFDWLLKSWTKDR